MRQSECLAHTTHQRLEDFVRTDGRGDFLEDVEQEVPRAQRILRFTRLRAGADVRVEARAQLRQLDRRHEGVPRPGEQHIGRRLSRPVRQQDEDRRATVRRLRRQRADFIREIRGAGVGGVEDEIGRTDGRRFGDLKAAADQHALQTLGTAGRTAEQKNAVTKQVRQNDFVRARGGGKV